MNLKVKICPLPPIMSNCYIVKGETGEAFLIDPAVSDKRLDKILEDEGITQLKYILLTHGHFDHINGAAELRRKYGGQIAVHEADAICLKDATESRAALFGMPSVSFNEDISLKDGDALPFDNGEIKVIHTPGHTRGSVCYKAGNHLFTGDTLFSMTVGRTDFPGGSMTEMMNSMEKLKRIEENCFVYPGHEETSMLDREKNHNPYMKGI